MIITEIQSIWLLTKSQSTQIHGDLMIIYLDRNWYFWFTDTSDLNIRIRLFSGLMHVLFHLDIFTQTYSVPLCYKGDGIILCNGIHSFPKLVHQETLDGTLRAPPLACDSQVVGYRCSLTFFVRKYKLLMFIMVHASQTTCCAWHISGSWPRYGTIYFGYMLKIIGLHVPI